MKRDDVAKIFPGATEDQIDEILNQIGSELNPLKRDLREASKSRDEALEKLTQTENQNASYKAQVDDLSAKVKAGMTAEELLAQQQEQAAAREHEFLLKSNAVDAKSLFVAAGCFEEAEITSLVEQVVGEDLETTLTKAKSIIDVVQRHGKSVEETTKNDLLKSNPKLSGVGAGSGGMTKEQFDKLGYKEQVELISENPGLLQDFAAKKTILQ